VALALHTCRYPRWPSVPEDVDPEDAMLNDEGQPEFSVSFTFDARSESSARNYVTIMMGVKQAGFQEHWQSPHNIYTIAEVVGKDSSANMEANCRYEDATYHAQGPSSVLELREGSFSNSTSMQLHMGCNAQCRIESRVDELSLVQACVGGDPEIGGWPKGEGDAWQRGV
jgi:hypothetical protein